MKSIIKLTQRQGGERMSNVIYVDILLLINLLINFLLLSAAELLMRSPARKWRILLSSTIGAVYSLIILVPELNAVLSVFLRIACFTAMLFTAFSIHTFREFLRAGGSFLAVNFAFAGIMLAVWLIFKPDGMMYKNGAVYFDIGAVTLILTSVVCYLVVKLISYLLRRNAPDSHIVDLSIVYGNADISCIALLDTGSALKEPFSSYPAIVCEYSLLEPLLDDGTKALMTNRSDDNEANPSLRFISFKSVGGSGLLPAVRAQNVILKLNGHSYSADKVYLAVYNGTLSGGEYRALVGNNFFEKAERGADKDAKADSGNKKIVVSSAAQKRGRNTLHKRLRGTASTAEKRRGAGNI